MSNRLFYRKFLYQKKDMARFLGECHGFDNLYRKAGQTGSSLSKLSFVKNTFLDLFFLLGRLRTIRRYDYIVAHWHSAIAFIILDRLGFIRYEKLLWFGFSVRDPLLERIYSWILKLDRGNTQLVVFTKQEIGDYARALGIDRTRLLFIPHGDWPQPIDVPDVFSPDPNLDLKTPFYFTGGFTNRDYRPVIDVFRELGLRLIIVCSKTSNDVVDSELPANIQVYRNISFPDFEFLLRRSKTVIIPLKEDAGAAGHSVMVRSMRNAKLVISNDFRIAYDYVDNGVDGLLLENMDAALRKTILEIENDNTRFDPIRAAAQERFRLRYSQEAIERDMTDLIEGRPVGSVDEELHREARPANVA